MKTTHTLMGIAALSLNVAALAQTTPGTGIEEIVVTAQRRSESLQNVPLSITALSAATLEARAVTSFFDYAGQVPNLAFASTGDGSGTARTISIRGISGDGTTGFYIDETPVPDSIDPRVLDVERVEVLRGPQGTLYGARSMGGTVRLITQQPDVDERGGKLHVSGSKTQNAENPNYGVDGSFNLPLNDRMALRFVGFFDHEAGYFKRTFLSNPADAALLPATADPTKLGGLPTTTQNDVGRVDSFGGALSLKIKASDALTITPRLMYQESDSNGLPYSDIGTYPVPGSVVPVNMHPSGFAQQRFFNIPESSYDSWTLFSLGIKYDSSVGTFFSSSSYFDRTVDETEDQTDFLWQNLLSPFDGIPLGDANNPNTPPYHAVPIASSIREIKQIHRFVQEFRFTSKFDGPTQLVTGLYFSDTRGRVPYAGYYPPAIAPGISQTGGFVVQNVKGLPIPVNAANPDEIFGQDYQTKVTEPAIYGELSYQFQDNLKGTVGARAYQIKTTTGGYLEGIAFGGARIVDPTAQSTDSGVNPKIGLDWKVAPDKLVYTQIAKGFRPGGLVPSVPGNAQIDPLGCFAQLQSLGYTSTAQTKSYKPDKLWNYEIGTKTAWADNTVTVDAAGFFIKWDQIQQSVALPCGFQFRANSGAAEVKGAELEVHARPTSYVDLFGGVGYQRARITEASSLLPSLHVGDRVYQVPDWTANANASYTIPFSGDRSLVGTLSWTYTGDSVSASVDANHPRVRPSYSIVDARLSYELNSCQIAVVGKNLANIEANLGDNRSLAAETLGRPRLVVNQPRTIGIEFRTKF
jgi:outer membrane receptor protein involved in Fe transport